MLSIGSNLGDRLAHLQGAVDAVRPWLVAVSPVYETAPWGPVPQDDYLNAVVLVARPGRAPRDWLDRAHAAEQAAGRTRDVRWGPRTLDVDVVAVDDVRQRRPGADPAAPAGARARLRARPVAARADPAAELRRTVAGAVAASTAAPTSVAGVRLATRPRSWRCA